MSFGSMLDGTFSSDLSGTNTRKIANKRVTFTEQMAVRLQNVQIECRDALKIIRGRDTPETFFYLDPPYPDTDQGHYDGYSSDDFRVLLETISKIEGKFLLSSFRHSALAEYTEKCRWSQFEIKMNKSITAQTGNVSKKIEVFTANYPIDPAGLGRRELFW
jgi:DNA adenine methylase